MLTTACASQFPLTGCVVKLAAQFVLMIVASYRQILVTAWPVRRRRL
jgi:hypothetical protein